MCPKLQDCAVIIELVLTWAIGVALTFAVVLVDERRMSEERLERAWPPSSRNAAIVLFGVLVLPVHFARTLGSFKTLRGVLGILLGFAIGIVGVLVVAILSQLLVDGIGLLLGLRFPETME
jgi:hypothetical protein